MNIDVVFTVLLKIKRMSNEVHLTYLVNGNRFQSIVHFPICDYSYQNITRNLFNL